MSYQNPSLESSAVHIVIHIYLYLLLDLGTTAPEAATPADLIRQPRRLDLWWWRGAACPQYPGQTLFVMIARPNYLLSIHFYISLLFRTCYTVNRNISVFILIS